MVIWGGRDLGRRDLALTNRILGELGVDGQIALAAWSSLGGRVVILGGLRADEQTGFGVD